MISYGRLNKTQIIIYTKIIQATSTSNIPEMQIRQQQIFQTMNVEYIDLQQVASNDSWNQILLVMQ